MASPREISCTNLTGKFSMNKSLGDDLDAMLALQGISWFLRKIIGATTPAITVKEYKDDQGKWHIDILSVASGLSSQQENRTLDWTERDHKDRIFGNMRGKSRMFKTGDFQMEGPGGEDDAAFLRAERLKDGSPSKFVDDEHVQSWVVNQDAGYGWTAEQVWGFEEIDGKRYHTRRVVARKDDKVERLRLVYNYTGPVDGKAEADADEDDGLAYGES
ncbi:uncharacterized protein HMPREF1541_00074 [Cyphellophora europaea CBS 101466]|uniref:Uncharacterized protein n=1 Tax=Cyphellophora europaea (strain CBS 101466) TaxID=1220924 RepID=W2SD17_CYPE1|nr:uncharacterized protein HMPREF1541_00074 [Cyphellophora europaea CBS 101466]ETN45893.1 hypothetical protein HMPREF1541_00074 [Cyphellophora europaea CBS 101466]